MALNKRLFSLHLVCTFAVALGLSVFFGCTARENKKTVPDKVSARKIQQQPISQKKEVHYTSDLDRLDCLTARINKAYRANNVVVLGSGSSSSGTISVDYSLFDRLSDDGVAVLIAEAIENPKTVSALQSQNQIELQKKLLQADENVGRIVAIAEFSDEGFGQWLEAKDIFEQSSAGNEVSKQQRSDAFIRGYRSVKAADSK